MFETNVYKKRREVLKSMMLDASSEGLVIFVGNVDAPINYRGNDYKFRQDSNFLYYWGIDEPGFAASIDLNTGEEVLYANDVDMEDIIWMGPQPSVQSKADRIGVAKSAPRGQFDEAVIAAKGQGRSIHFLPASRYYNTYELVKLIGLSADEVRSTAPVSNGLTKSASEALVEAVIAMRIVKEDVEIQEIDKACDLGYMMHTAARVGCKVGVKEQVIVGQMESVAMSYGWGTSFTTILSQNGETLHNHSHGQIITPGRLLLVDAGVESNTHYASDFTRTYPSSGKFTDQQREIYDIVHGCNDLATSIARPGMSYYDVQWKVLVNMLEGLKNLDIVRGDAEEMVAAGISGLFMPHGLGHNMGMDVHDMEDLGELRVGYDKGQTRHPLMGLGNLRMARNLCPGHVITNEPGIYFIPDLIKKWKSAGTDKGMVNYEKLEKYYDFGGIRLEDDILITADGARILGSQRLPISSKEVEERMAAE